MKIYVMSDKTATTEVVELQNATNEEAEFLAVFGELDSAYQESFHNNRGEWSNRGGFTNIEFVETSDSMHVNFKIPNLKFFEEIASFAGQTEVVHQGKTMKADVYEFH